MIEAYIQADIQTDITRGMTEAYIQVDIQTDITKEA